MRSTLQAGSRALAAADCRPSCSAPSRSGWQCGRVREGPPVQCTARLPQAAQEGSGRAAGAQRGRGCSRAVCWCLAGLRRAASRNARLVPAAVALAAERDASLDVSKVRPPLGQCAARAQQLYILAGVAQGGLCGQSNLCSGLAEGAQCSTEAHRPEAAAVRVLQMEPLGDRVLVKPFEEEKARPWRSASRSRGALVSAACAPPALYISAPGLQHFRHGLASPGWSRGVRPPAALNSPAQCRVARYPAVFSSLIKVHLARRPRWGCC